MCPSCVNRCCCSRIIWVRSCSRWVEMPMQIYRGPGVTQSDLLEETNECLASIATSLRQCCISRCGGRSCGCGNSGCGNCGCN